MNMNDFAMIAINTMPKVENNVQKIEKGLMFAGDHLEEAAAAYAQIAAGAQDQAYVDAMERLGDMLGHVLADIAMICDGTLMSMNCMARRYIIKSLKDLTQVSRGEAVEAVEEGPIPPMTLLRRIYEMAGKAVQSDE